MNEQIARPGVAGSPGQGPYKGLMPYDPEDAEWFAGDPVDGPLTAYSQAQIINDHALEATEGQTYAQMDREDPLRAVAMSAAGASMLRISAPCSSCVRKSPGRGFFRIAWL